MEPPRHRPEQKADFSDLQTTTMKTALFHNFTKSSFTGYWDGKPHTFKAGEKKYMPEYLAMHFAKHLTNQVLLEKGGKYENYTSPKNPSQVPQFKELFDKACIVEEDQEDVDEATVETDVANKPLPKAEKSKGPGKEAQVITPPEGDDDENFED